ncbi:hypothetical protein ACWC24_35235 [Streptomyces sp. NPDC001443]
MEQNPACFGAGTRAAATYPRQTGSRSEPGDDKESAAVCELVGLPVEDC